MRIHVGLLATTVYVTYRNFVQMNKEEETMNSGRRRRSAQVPYQGIEVVAIPRSMKNRIDQYFDWRRINGYGRISRRWGK